MIRRGRLQQRGIALVDLLLSLALIWLLATALFSSLRAISGAWAVGQHRVGITQHGRNAIEWMARRIRLAGQGTPGGLAIYVVAEAGRLEFWGDTVPGSGESLTNPMERMLYAVSGGRLVESVTSAGTTTTRNLTATEEVGIITVTSVNFCYYDIFDNLIDQTLATLADGTESCSGTVTADNLGRIYRIKIRLGMTSGRPGEAPLVLTTQVARRLEVLP
jgi:hypothetical protein